MTIKNDGTFVVLRSAGIGNRIKSYVSHLARWDNIKVQHPADALLFKNFKLASIEDIEKLPHTGSVWRLLVDEDEEIYIDGYKSIDFLYEKIPQYFIKKYQPIFQSLKFSEDVEKMVNDVSSDWKNENMIGINIRATTSSFGRDKFVDLEQFEEIVDGFDHDQIFYFSSDSIQLRKFYKNKYGDRCVSINLDNIIDTGFTDDYQQNLEALVEILLLSKCEKKLFLTEGSTFGECAWWFGGCKAEVYRPTIMKNVSNEWENTHFIKK